MALFHITTRTAWDEAVAAGVYRPVSLEREGFIHLSTEEQLAATGKRWFAGQSGLVVLRCAVEADARWDDTPDGKFPHLYRPLAIAEVVEVVAFDPDAPRAR